MALCRDGDVGVAAVCTRVHGAASGCLPVASSCCKGGGCEWRSNNASSVDPRALARSRGGGPLWVRDMRSAPRSSSSRCGCRRCCDRPWPHKSQA